MKFLIGFSVYMAAAWVFLFILMFIDTARTEHWTLKKGFEMLGPWLLAMFGWVLVIPAWLNKLFGEDEEKEVIDEE